MRTAAVVLASMLALHAAAAEGPAFQPPLAVPAVQSALAARSPVQALARTGQRLVAAGARGHIVYSDDGGATWTQARVPVSSDLVALHFASSSKGWAVGHEGVILHSADGGASWVKQADGGAALDRPLLDVCFEDEQRGVAVGAFGLLLHTEDGGKSWKSWQERSENAKELHLYGVRPAGGTLVAVGEQGLVLKLDRAAGQWRAVPLPYQGTLFGLLGSERELLVFGLRGTLLRSVDGGGSWQRQETGVRASLTAAALRADGRTVLVSQSGELLLAQGEAWQRIKPQRPAPTFAALEIAPGKLALAGPRGVRVEALQ